MYVWSSFSVPFAILVIKNSDRIVLDLMFHKPERHDRKHPVIKHRIQECTGTVCLPDCLNRNLMPRCIVFKKLPGSASLLAYGKRFSGEILYLDTAFLIKRMIFACGKHQAVIYDRENGKVRRKNLAFNDSGIQFRTKELLFNVLGITHIRMDPDIRADFL